MIPDIIFCKVSASSKEIAFKQAVGGAVYATKKIEPFLLGKYLVTNWQYNAFYGQEHYKESRYWHFEGKADRDQQKAKRVSNPYDSQDQTSFMPIDNFPVNNVSWYHALAFTRWLHEQYEAHGIIDSLFKKLPKTISNKNKKKYRISLPLEWEWQWAASGEYKNKKAEDAEERVYPWGPDWRDKGANTLEAGLKSTTAVGMYPHPKAKCGALDMAGNVFEWCLNDFMPVDRVDLVGGELKVIRGGSFATDHYSSTTNYRKSKNPGVIATNVGFRLVFAYREDAWI